MQDNLNLKSEFNGALAAAIITLPMSIGYGIITFASLGQDFAPYAALLGLYSAVFSGVVVALFRSTQVHICGPKAPLTLIVTPLVVLMATQSGFDGSFESAIHIVVLMSLAVFLCGGFQVLFGALRMGKLIRYVPFPVIAGFMNGIAFMLIYKQLKTFFGLPHSADIFDLTNILPQLQWTTFLVGALTLITIKISKKMTKKIPASIVGVILGSLYFYAAQWLFGKEALGAVIGRIQSGLPLPYLFTQFKAAVTQLPVLNFLPEILLAGLVLAFIASIESLFSAIVADDLTGTRHNSNRELIGQGFGNMACALFGALPSAGSIPRTAAAIRAGGKTPLTGLISALLIFAIILLVTPLVGYLPLVVVSAVVVNVALGMFDAWTVKYIKNARNLYKQSRDVLLNLVVILIVTLITVAFNLITAVGIGIVVSAIFFIARISQAIVHREFDASQISSKKIRPENDVRILNEKGQLVKILELQGPLFFGTSGNLQDAVADVAKNCSICILDLKQVSEIDSSGAHALRQIKIKLDKEKKTLLLSYLYEKGPYWKFLKEMELLALIGLDRIFYDTDDALEWAEDQLLLESRPPLEKGVEVPLETYSFFENFTKEEFDEIAALMEIRHYKKGDIVIHEGDNDRDIFFMTKGCVSIKTRLQNKNRRKRFVTFSPGVVFGEMAFLDGSVRSADVYVEEDSKIMVLAYEKFLILQQHNPLLSHKFITSIAIELNARLRATSAELRFLEDT